MGTAERIAREKEERRQAIIDAAEKLFYKNGFENTTMDEIADETELSKGTLYLYFKSKNELLWESVTKVARILNFKYEKATKDSKNGLAMLNDIGKTYFDFISNNAGYVKLTMHLSSMGARTYPQSRSFREFQKEMEINNSYLINAFKKGIQDGSISPDIEPIKAAIYFGIVSEAIFKTITIQGDRMKKQLGIEPEEFFDFAYGLLGNSVRKR